MSAELKASRRDATLILTLSNPAAKNALHPDMYAAAIETLSTAERDDSIRGVVLTGANNYFCSGISQSRLSEYRLNDTGEQAESLTNLHGWIEALRDCPKPVIAAIEDTAAGAGFSLALACDFIIAGTSAKFVMPHAAIGSIPEGGGTWLLAHALPRQLAAEILLEGKPVSALRLHELGIVNKLVVDGNAFDAALEWSDHFSTLSSNSIERIKSLVHSAHDLSLAQHFEIEKHHFIESLHHRDAQEHILPSFQKKKPS